MTAANTLIDQKSMARSACPLWLTFASMIRPTSALPSQLVLRRNSVKMQYGAAQQGYGAAQQGYSHDAQQDFRAQQDYGAQENYGAEVVWSLAAYSGVVGYSDVADACSMWKTLFLDLPMQTGNVPTPAEVEFALNINQQIKNMAADVTARGGSAAEIYSQDYRYLPYTLRNGEMQVLSRWNMANQRNTVSRVQCKVRVSVDGTATLTSCGKGPTFVRAWGGPWLALYKDKKHVLSDGDQVRAHLPASPRISLHLHSRRGTPWAYR